MDACARMREGDAWRRFSQVPSFLATGRSRHLRQTTVSKKRNTFSRDTTKRNRVATLCNPNLPNPFVPLCNRRWFRFRPSTLLPRMPQMAYLRTRFGPFSVWNPCFIDRSCFFQVRSHVRAYINHSCICIRFRYFSRAPTNLCPRL